METKGEKTMNTQQPLDPYKNYWREFPSISPEYERGKDWRAYELWDLKGLRLASELSREVHPLADTAHSMLYQALSALVQATTMINRRLRHIEKQLEEKKPRTAPCRASPGWHTPSSAYC
jgi:hypothetical protein